VGKYWWPLLLLGFGALLGGGGLWLWDRYVSNGRYIREGEIREVEFTHVDAGNARFESWVLTVYGNGHGLLKVEGWSHNRSVLFSMPRKIRDLIGAFARCDVRHLPSDLGQSHLHEEVRTIKIRTSTFEKTIEIHGKLDESEENARCVLGVWRRAVMISEEAQKIRETQQPGKSQ
jgi:hypothetical protein